MKAPGKRGLLGFTPALVVLALWAISARAPVGPLNAGGQVIAVAAPATGESKPEEEPLENVFLPAERSALKLLSKARELLKTGRHAEAVRCLGAILEGPEDYFFQPDRNAPLHRSLKAEAQRLIGQMPRRGREFYELQYGARARRMLEEATTEGDATRLAEVSRRFFHTQAGHEATFLLGLYHLDHARPLAGALTLGRLQDVPGSPDAFDPALSLAIATCWLRSGMPDRAQEVLTLLAARNPNGAVQIAGKDIPLPGKSDELLQWLAAAIGPQAEASPAQPDQWTMARGNASRNSSSAGSAPLMNMRWQIPTTDHPLVQGIIEYLDRIFKEQGVPVMPGLQPLAVDNVVLMRTARNLLALDFTTGKRLWEVPADELPSKLVPTPGRNVSQGYSQLAMGLSQRVWEDATYGTMTSDGRLVFSIEDLGLNLASRNSRHIIINGRRQANPNWPKTHNRLAAHDIRTGKLIWHLGGSGDEFDLPHAGTFFLGPPLPLMGRLYILAEVKGEIRLVALDAKSGNTVWSQQLNIVERDILRSPLRRYAGVSPSYADGVLVCPTTNGAVVGVEMATRSLLWGYRYARGTKFRQHPRARMQIGILQNPTTANRWFDANAILADGHVLVTPVESDYLHCLALLDGEQAWRYKREDELYVACVYEDNVVLIGRAKVHALKISDGTPAWDGRAVELPEDAVPSGRGFLADGHYFLPLSTAEVLKIDLAKGTPVGTSRSRDGNVPGNLVCYRGNVISQGSGGIEAFHQLDALRKEIEKTLKEHPDDTDALTLHGEILLDSGKRSEAIDSFRRSYKLAQEPKTHELLRLALLEGLEKDFKTARANVAEIERLIDKPEQKAKYLQLMAAGLQASGEWQAALDSYMKLIDLDQDHHRLERVDRSLSVRWDRRIQGQLAGLYAAAPAEVKAQIDKSLEARLDVAVEAGKPEPLRRFIDYFANHATAYEAQQHLVRRLKQADRLLEAEFVLREMERSSQPPRVAAAVAELAAMLREAGLPEDAAVCYKRLRDELADVTCPGDKTGRQLVDALPDDDPVAKWLESTTSGPTTSWPIGLVEVKKETKSAQRSHNRGSFSLGYQGTRRPFFTGKRIAYDQSRRMAVGRDGFGNKTWEVALAEPNNRHGFPYNQNWSRVSARGHLLLLSMGYKVIAVDTLHADSPKRLWSQDLVEPVFAQAKTPPFRIAAINNMPFGMMGFHMMRSFGTTMGSLGVVTDRYACYWRFRSCVAADPLTGDVLWLRRDVPRGSALMGDDQYVLAAPPDGTEALVLRATDGKLLGKRKMPSPQFRKATFGRNILIWQLEDNQYVLDLFDPWEQKSLWKPRKFSPEAKIWVAEEEAVAVMEPDGHVLIFGLPDGRTIVDTKLEPENPLTELFLLPLGDQYIFVTHSRPETPPGMVQPNAIPRVLSRPIIRGRAYAFDRQGKKLWPEPVDIENQQLPLTQAEQLPIVTFACRLYDRNAKGTRRNRVSILCIDKRNGRTAYSEEIPNSTSVFELSGDPVKKTVTLALQRNTVKMTFTDKPLPSLAEVKKAKAEAAAKKAAAAAKHKLPKTTGALLKALMKGIGGIGPADKAKGAEAEPPAVEKPVVKKVVVEKPAVEKPIKEKKDDR